MLHAGEAVDTDPPTCALHATVADVRAALDGSRYGFCLVLSERRILLGRVRRTALERADAKASAESVMEPGPSTVRLTSGVVRVGDTVAWLREHADAFRAALTTGAGRPVD